MLTLLFSKSALAIEPTHETHIAEQLPKLYFPEHIKTDEELAIEEKAEMDRSQERLDRILRVGKLVDEKVAAENRQKNQQNVSDADRSNDVAHTQGNTPKTNNNGSTTNNDIKEPKFGSKEWLKKITHTAVDAMNEFGNIIMPTVSASIIVCVFSFFLIFSIFPNHMKLPMKRKIKVILSPFFPSLIFLFFADMLPEFHIDGEIDYDTKYYVLVFVFLLSCWIVWKRAKEPPLIQNKNA